MRVVAGRYRVQKKVGSGGFCTVWRGEDREEDGPDVAVKFPKSEDQGPNRADDVRPRFRHEYKILSEFGDGVMPSSMVRFITGRGQDPMCIVTEYIDGPSLADRMTSRGASFGMDAVTQFGLPIVRALEFLHWNSLCYYDCKPENVLIRSRAESPVLIDFNTTEPERDEATLFHEDQYKAPEQVPTANSSHDPGPRSDVYAVGKLLVYLLTGETRNTLDTPDTGLSARQLGAGLSRDVDRVIKRATHANPRRRQRNAGELYNELSTALNRDRARGLLTDEETRAVCPVRDGDTIGRVEDRKNLPTIGVRDPDRYVSLVQFELQHSETDWELHDCSVNGTYVRYGNEWKHILSADGYQRLQEESPRQVPSERPYPACRLGESRKISPVDPSYPVTLRFESDTHS